MEVGTLEVSEAELRQLCQRVSDGVAIRQLPAGQEVLFFNRHNQALFARECSAYDQGGYLAECRHVMYDNSRHNPLATDRPALCGGS